MSDLSIYEFDDIIWERFGKNEDYIVPYSSDKNASGHASQPGSCKKPSVDVDCMTSSAEEKAAARCHNQEKRDYFPVNIPKLEMLRDDLWSYTPDNMFSASCDGDPIKQPEKIASDNTKISSTYKINTFGDLCSDDHILNSRVDSNPYSFPLHSSRAENDLSYVDIRGDECNDLLYYSFADTEIEDVDRIYRNCDSLSGLPSINNDDEIDWLSLSNAVEGSEAAPRSNFTSTDPYSIALRSLSEDTEPSTLKNESSPAKRMSMIVPDSQKATSQLSETGDPALQSCISNVNGSNQTSESTDNIILRDQPWKKGEEMEIGQHVEKGEPLYHIGDTFHNDQSSITVQQHKQNSGPNSFDYLLANTTCSQLDYHQKLYQNLVSPTLSGTKLVINSQSHFPQEESSRSFKVSQHMECCQDISDENFRAATKEGRGELQHHQGVQASLECNTCGVDLASFCIPVPMQIDNELESNIDTEGVGSGVPIEVGCRNLQESSSMSSTLSEGSLEVTSFLQLQQVMEQLDLRTKLCIRDSLYRLARSAEQRHHNANLNGGPGGGSDARSFMAEGTNKCVGFADIEIDTNPIDRSVAHLLFHRPSLPLNSQSTIPGSVISPMMAENICKESAAETDQSID